MTACWRLAAALTADAQSKQVQATKQKAITHCCTRAHLVADVLGADDIAVHIAAHLQHLVADVGGEALGTQPRMTAPAIHAEECALRRQLNEGGSCEYMQCD